MQLCNGVEIEGKQCVVVGRSNIVGKPMAALLMQKAAGANATVTVVHSGTPDIRRYTLDADILVAAIGKPEFVRGDIVRILGLRDPFTVITGFDRPNLSFDVQKPKNKTASLLAFLRSRYDKSGIVYCATRANVDKLYEELTKQGMGFPQYCNDD